MCYRQILVHFGFFIRYNPIYKPKAHNERILLYKEEM